MVDRRALVVGSWLAKGRDKPTPQRVRSILERWRKIFVEDKYGFRNLKRKRLPTILSNPLVRDLFAELENPINVTADTELLVYFVGHSVSAGDQDIRLILGMDDKGEDRSFSFKLFLDMIYDQTRIRKLVLILDTCHAGRTRDVFRALRETSYAMFAGGDSYAFDANFSDGLLRALEHPFQRNDQRIDRRAGGMTYKKLFEDARRRVLLAMAPNSQQDPKSFGDYGGEVIRKAPVVVPDAYNPFAASRSVYGRVFRLLEIIGQKNPTYEELHRALQREDDIFLLRRGQGGQHRYLSKARLNEYVEFLRKAGWVAQPGGRHTLTPSGIAACRVASFNKALRTAIEDKVLSDGVTFEFLDKTVSDLLEDMIPPTPPKIAERAAMKGIVLNLDVATRVAMQLLPSTGRFLKGATDALYPSELGG